MPYADKDKAKKSALQRGRAYRARKHAEKYGPGAPSMAGKHGNHARGERHPRWNAGRMITSHGYVVVRVDPSHPHAFGGRYAYEHIIVAERAAGRLLAPNEIVHHRNGNKTDNRPENLEILTASAHMTEHNAQRERDDLGRFTGADLRGCRAFPEVP